MLVNSKEQRKNDLSPTATNIIAWGEMSEANETLGY